MNAPVQTLQTLEPRPLYGIGTVARLTGLKSDTLRVWERRYGLGASYKSPTGRRQYLNLDHVQLVSALVNRVRIGEIAASDRKTLRCCSSNRTTCRRQASSPVKRDCVFGCRSLPMGRRASRLHLGHFALLKDIGREALVSLPAEQNADILVVHCPSLTLAQIDGVKVVAERLAVRRTIVLYQFGNDQWLAELERLGHSAFQYPIEPSQLAFEIGRSQVERATEEGIGNVSEFMPAKPRLFSDAALRAAAEEKIVLDRMPAPPLRTDQIFE